MSSCTLSSSIWVKILPTCCKKHASFLGRLLLINLGDPTHPQRNHRDSPIFHTHRFHGSRRKRTQKARQSRSRCGTARLVETASPQRYGTMQSAWRFHMNSMANSALSTTKTRFHDMFRTVLAAQTFIWRKRFGEMFKLFVSCLDFDGFCLLSFLLWFKHHFIKERPEIFKEIAFLLK